MTEGEKTPDPITWERRDQAFQALWQQLKILTGVDRILKTAKIDHSTLGDNQIVAAVADKKIQVYAVLLVVSAAVNCKWKSGSTELSGDMNFNGKGDGYADSVEPPAIIMQTGANEALILNLSGAVAVDGMVAYWEEA